MECGTDYRRVEVGMDFARVRRCAGPFESVGQVQLAAGVATVYRAAGGTVQVINGKVTAWIRRR